MARLYAATGNEIARLDESELAELLRTGGFGMDLALLREALREALEDAEP